MHRLLLCLVFFTTAIVDQHVALATATAEAIVIPAPPPPAVAVPMAEPANVTAVASCPAGGCHATARATAGHRPRFFERLRARRHAARASATAE